MGKISALITLPPVPDKFEEFEEVVKYLNDLTYAIHAAVSDFQNEFNGKVEVVNQLIKEVSITDTGAVDTEFTVNHNLGRIPTYYWYTINKAGIVYDSRRADWTISLMYLKCNQANAALKLAIPL